MKRTVYPEVESALAPEVQSIQVCEQGQVLLQHFLDHGTPFEAGREAERLSGYREFGRNPYWRAFTQHWAGCLECSGGKSGWVRI